MCFRNDKFNMKHGTPLKNELVLNWFINIHSKTVFSACEGKFIRDIGLDFWHLNIKIYETQRDIDSIEEKQKKKHRYLGEDYWAVGSVKPRNSINI